MPSSHDALVQALTAQDFAAVERCANELLRIQPNQAFAWQALGVAQLRQNRADDAVEALQRAISLGAKSASLRFELACALEQLGRWDEAVKQLRQAATLDPQSAEVQINLAALLEKLDAPEEGLRCGQLALTLQPSNAIAHYNVGSVLQSLGRLDEAIAAYSRAIELDDQFALAYTNRGCCRLLQRYETAGWKDYEWRLETPQVRVAAYPQPRWQGQPLPEGTLLVHGEQGIGDEIQFGSSLPEVVTRVGKCVLVCHPRLAKLMARSFPAVMVVPDQRPTDSRLTQLPAPIDFQIPAGSLPLYLRTTLANFPSRKRFLLADPQKKQFWRKQFESLGTGLKVGISWRGGIAWEERRKRTTALEQWKPLLSVSGAHFINLQYGDCLKELNSIQGARGDADIAKTASIKIHHFKDADPFGCLDDFAAKVAALDLVISVGNSTVHLAGALGLDTWCLLPLVPQWRWGLRSETTPWYPSVRLLRQTQRGNWEGVLSEAARKLSELVNGAGPAPPTTQPVRSKELVKTLLQIKATPGAKILPAQKLLTSNLLAEATQLFNDNRFDEAGQLAEKVLASDANNVVALRICGAAARKASQLECSLELLTRALRLSPEHPVLHFELGITHLELKKYREAYDCCLKSIQFNPSFQPAYVNLSAILEQQERYEESMVWARKAGELKPDCPLSHYNLANQLRECGRVNEAVKHYQTAVQLQPNYVKAKWNLAICYVLLGRFSDAWPLHEIRDEAEEVKLDKYTQPRWDGSSLAGKSIVVHAEQGIGDEVLFASCFPDVIEQAAKTILVCEPRLVKLFARSFPRATVLGWARRKDWSPLPLTEPVDFQIPAGSLPLYLRSSAESFPRRERFLIADQESVEQWRRRFAELGTGLKIGIAWRAGGKANEGRKRTIRLADWRAILQTPSVQFVNLQYGDISEDVEQIKQKLGVGVHDWEQGDPLVDMDEHAAKVAALDLVISVGNATVHLAGALGTPAWTLLPRVPSWRWMVTGDYSPWYSSVRLFRQPQRLEWEPVLRQIAARLQEVALFATQGNSTAAVRERILAVRPENKPSEECSLEPRARANEGWIDANQLNCRQPLQVIAVLQEQAEEAFRSRDFEVAERCYREILQITPRHMLAHVQLGLIARKTGRYGLAIRCLQRGLGIVEANATNHAQLAAVLSDTGRGGDALQHARRALELDAKLPEAHREFGRALHLTGNSTAAIAVLHKTLRMLPNDPATIGLLSQALTAAGQLDKSQELLQCAIERAPEQSLLRLALGRVLWEDQCFAEAEQNFRKAIELQPELAEAHYELARVFTIRNEIEAAIGAGREALQAAPQFLPGMLHLATLLRQQNSTAEAEILYREALELRPDSAELHRALSQILAAQRDFAGAMTQIDSAIQLQPEQAAIHLDRARLLLRTGRFGEGWDEFDWRLRDSQQWGYPSQFKQPLWDGSPLAQRSILIYGEENLVDEIMFTTCYPEIIQQAGRCVVVCNARLERLLRRSFPQASVLGIPPGGEQTWKLPEQITFDVQCAAGTLPRYLRRSEDVFPRHEQLLIADQQRAGEWRKQWAALGGGPKIGICWQADDSASKFDQRYAALAEWQLLLSAPGIQWINLQAGNYRVELAEASARHKLKIHDTPAADRQYDLDNLAAMIAGLDLVITVDNTTAHLAAALGIPAWIILHEPADWRWLTERADSVWYQNVRLFRQNRLQPFGKVFQQMREELLKRDLRLDEESKIGSLSGPHWPKVPARASSKQPHNVE